VADGVARLDAADDHGGRVAGHPQLAEAVELVEGGGPGVVGDGEAAPAGEDRGAGDRRAGDDLARQRREGGPVVVAHVVGGPPVAAAGEGLGGFGPGHDAGAGVPVGPDDVGVEERQRRGRDVGVDVPQHAGAAGEVEGDALEPVLAADRVGCRVEHEPRAELAHRPGRGGRDLVTVHRLVPLCACGAPLSLDRSIQSSSSVAR
jgi:hypothetical protein